MTFSPSPLQAKAIQAIKDWFTNRTAAQQVFRVFGYAGTGKTTITRHAIAELGLDTVRATACSMQLHRQGGFGHDTQGYAGLDHPLTGLPRLRGDAGESKVKAELPISGIVLGAASAVRGIAASLARLRLSDIHKPRFVLNEHRCCARQLSCSTRCRWWATTWRASPCLRQADRAGRPRSAAAVRAKARSRNVSRRDVRIHRRPSAIIRLATLARMANPSYGKHDNSSGRCAGSMWRPSRCCAAARSRSTPRACSSTSP